MNPDQSNFATPHDEADSRGHGVNTEIAAQPMPTEAQRADAGDGILSTLADLESRVNSLKQFHAQSTARTTELLKKEADLAQRERTLAEREGGLSSRESGLSQRESGLEERLAEWRRTSEQVQEQQQKMSLLEQGLEEQRRQIESVRTKLEQDAALTGERERESQERERASQEREREVERHRKDVEVLEAELDRERSRLAGREDALTIREQRTAESEKQAALANQQRTAELEAWAATQRSQIEAASIQLTARRVELEHRENTLTEREQELNKREAELDRRDRDINQRMQESAEQHARLTAQGSRLERMQQEQREREAEISQERDRLAALESQLAGLQGEFDERRAAFEHEVDVTRASLQTREEQIRTLEATIREREGEIKDRLGQMDCERAKVTEQQRTLMAQAQSEHSGAGAISSGRLEMLQIQIGEANALRAAAEEELAQARSESQALQLRLTELEQAGDRVQMESEVSKRDHAIMVLRERLQELQTAHAALKDKVTADTNGPEGKRHAGEGKGRGKGRNASHDSSAGTHTPAAADAQAARWNTIRRQRLSRYKSLLQQQARKVMSAQAGLQKRHSECEQILSHRQKLSALAQELAKREKSIASSKARSGAFIGIIAATVAIGVLGLISWQAAQRIFPGQYIARASIEADAHGRQPTAEELAAWQKYHEELVTNPQYHEVSAERMNRRGVVSLARPAELSAKLKKDLYVQSTEPGQLTLEITEEGAGRATMVLDTLVTALKSVSDAGREQRSQDLGVTIVQTAASEARPINEKTLMGYAGGIFGGAVLAVGLFGTLIWARLMSSKRRFDQSQAVEEALSDVDWASIEQSLKRSAAGESVISRPTPAAAAAPAGKKKKDRN